MRRTCMSTASSTRKAGSHERRYHTVSSVFFDICSTT